MSRPLSPVETLQRHLALSAERCAELAEAAMVAGNQRNYTRYTERYRQACRRLAFLRDPEGYRRALRVLEVRAAFRELRALPAASFVDRDVPELPGFPPFEEAA